MRVYTVFHFADKISGLHFTFTFIHLADAFIQSDLQMRTIEAIRLTVGQQYISAMALRSSI